MMPLSRPEAIRIGGTRHSLYHTGYADRKDDGIKIARVVISIFNPGRSVDNGNN